MSFKIMVGTLSFLLGYERIEENSDSEGSSSEDDSSAQKPQVVLSREAFYKTGGLSNRQKEHKMAMPLAAKRAKVARSRQERKKQQRRSGKVPS